MKTGIEKELERGKPGSSVMKYALPAIMSGLVASLYNIIDQVFIGNIVGTEGNAATNVAFPLVTLTTAFMLLIGLGGTVNFNISLGRKNIKDAKKYAGVIIFLAPFIGILISLVTIIFSSELLNIFGATKDNFGLAHTYINITAFGFPFSMASAAYAKLIRSDGAPRYSMACLMVGAILNCILNPLLMIDFNMGIAGAAWATVIGQVVSFLVASAYFFKFKSFKIRLKEIIPSLQAIKKSLIMGGSPFLNQLTMMLTQIVLNNVLGHYGALSVYGAEIPLACVGIISKVTSLYMAVMIGIAQGAQPLLGFSYGAGKTEKVKEIYFLCLKFASAISIMVFLLFQIFPTQILSLFGARDELYFDFGVMYFRIFMFMTFLNGIQPITANFFSAIAKPIRSTIVSLSKQLLCLVPLVLILPMIFGINGVLFAGPIADTLAFVITIIFLRIEMKNLENRKLA